MREIKYLFLILAVIYSCNNISNSPGQKRIKPLKTTTSSIALTDSTAYFDAVYLNNLLLSDTIKLDSVKILCNNKKCLDIPIEFSRTTRHGVGRSGGLLHTITSLMTSRSTFSLTSIQAALLSDANNNSEALSVLLQSGADPNAISIDSITSLDWANKSELKLSVCDTLIKYGANPKLIDLKYCQTDLKKIDFFVKLGANPKTISWSSFLDASYRYRKENRRGQWKTNFYKVLEYGINPQRINQFEIYLFVRSNHDFEPEIMERLISKGLNLNQPLEFELKKSSQDKYEYWLDYVIDNHYSEELLLFLINNGAKKTRSNYNIYEHASKHRYSVKTMELIESTFGK